MDTKQSFDNRRCSCMGGGLSRGVYKNLFPFLVKSYTVSSEFVYIAPLI